MIYKEAIAAATQVANSQVGANRQYDPTWMVAFNAAVSGYQACHKTNFAKIIKNSEEGEVSVGKTSDHSQPTA